MTRRRARARVARGAGAAPDASGRQRRALIRPAASDAAGAPGRGAMESGDYAPPRAPQPWGAGEAAGGAPAGGAAAAAAAAAAHAAAAQQQCTLVHVRCEARPARAARLSRTAPARTRARGIACARCGSPYHCALASRR